MRIVWRWDQGRLEYFQYDEIKRIAQALVTFDGHALPRGGDPDTLRKALEQFSDQPFAPHRDDYPVWRNYGRVFGCQLLAVKVGGILVCTELCHHVATSSLDVDDYLLHFANHFYYPSPIFEGYQLSGEQKFPVISILKYLLAQVASGQYPSISLDEVADKIIGNNLTGLEATSDYLALKATGYTLSGDLKRQLRELLIFISQFSFLKWFDKKLHLDVSTKEEALAIESALKPHLQLRNADPSKELLSIGGGVEATKLGDVTAGAAVNPMDLEFVEGSKAKVTHLRSERSGKLRDAYYRYAHNPQMCNMCSMDTAKRYPWVDKVIELHHLLPLSSPVRFESETTSLKDIVGLCPSCHRATHKYYSKWLKQNSAKDFSTYAEARHVYIEAKASVVLI